MKKYNQSGGVAIVLSIFLLSAALIAALAFGYNAYKNMKHYKNDTDAIVNQAVAKAETAQKTKLDADFAEQEKSPNKTFKGPATFGTITFNYPKTWSAYVDQSNATEPINGYFYPDVVPSTQQSSTTPTAFALRVELVSTDYAQIVKQFDAQVKLGKVKAVAYIPPKMVGVTNVQTGTRFDGSITQYLTGSLVVIKVRDKTLEISTQSSDFLKDFNSTILPSLTFVP